MNKNNKEIFPALYIVPTPIGNLNDITYRAISVLKKVNTIAAENIFHTNNLLNFYFIKNKLTSFNKINEKNKSEILIKKLIQGYSIALVSNAGTPTINDPGYLLVSKCIEQNIKIIPLPGPCAFITALSASGISSDKFCYEGFLPKKKSKRNNFLISLSNESRTIILYESSNRLLSSLKAISLIFGKKRKIVIAKELTKIWEYFYRNTLEKILLFIKNKDIVLKGEWVLIIQGNEKKFISIPIEAINLFYILIKITSKKKALLIISKTFKIKKNFLYNYFIN
ncbi:yraL [Wigglesworthia glossinidia endosymbiont of Glossina brevipalpis]|uniref:Ribosomal RNA small subunit methyltransferase I n=1 Tax=Wigglesworthia glossinidia brevipalpis TaxID=36870 RepID=Q8D2A4_WIGBR|nr:yraL [Wigglesworthia glossinidia endosymbiont of Glossina brevipalpis]